MKGYYLKGSVVTTICKKNIIIFQTCKYFLVKFHLRSNRSTEIKEELWDISLTNLYLTPFQHNITLFQHRVQVESRMPKSRKKKVKHQDFAKVKLKVGKKLPRAANETDASFRSRSIQIKDQFRSSSEGDQSLLINKKKINIKVHDLKK